MRRFTAFCAAAVCAALLLALTACSKPLMTAEELSRFAALESSGGIGLPSGTPMTRTYVSGSFTATLRGFLPDYAESDDNRALAVVQEFQSDVFLIRVRGLDTSGLKVGEAYVFTVAPTELDAPMPSVERAGMSIAYYLEITGVRPANDDELGLASLQLTVAPAV